MYSPTRCNQCCAMERRCSRDDAEDIHSAVDESQTPETLRASTYAKSMTRNFQTTTGCRCSTRPIKRRQIGNSGLQVRPPWKSRLRSPISNMSDGRFDETRWHGVRLGVRPSVLISPSADGYLAYELETETLLHLNPTASLVLELCDGTRDVAELRDVLLPVVGALGWVDCCTWIHEALASGLLTGGPESTSDGPPMSASALTERAVALRADQRVVQAFICQQRATTLAPDDPEMWYRLGEFAQLVRRREDARVAYERYFAAHPEDAQVEYILHALSGAAPCRAPPMATSNKCLGDLRRTTTSAWSAISNTRGTRDSSRPCQLPLASGTGSRSSTSAAAPGWSDSCSVR